MPCIFILLYLFLAVWSYYIMYFFFFFYVIYWLWKNCVNFAAIVCFRESDCFFPHKVSVSNAFGVASWKWLFRNLKVISALAWLFQYISPVVTQRNTNECCYITASKKKKYYKKNVLKNNYVIGKGPSVYSLRLFFLS